MSDTTATTYKQAGPLRPGATTNYREVLTTRYTVHADITLDLTDADVLGAYRYQPNLERRHHLLKCVQDAAPILLHSPTPIEALFCCQLLALLIPALIARELRNNMTSAALDTIELYPELPACTSSSTERTREIFSTVARHQLHHQGTPVQTFQPELTAQQLQDLSLLGPPPSGYTQPTKSTR